MADNYIKQIKATNNTVYDIDAKKVNGHTVDKDVPSTAIFTDEKVKQTATAPAGYTNWGPIPVGASNNSAEEFSPTTTTDQLYTFNTISAQPSSGTIRASEVKLVSNSSDDLSNLIASDANTSNYTDTQIGNLQAQINSKASETHSHNINGISGLQDLINSLQNKVDTLESTVENLNILEKTYPVGAIYMSLSAISPQTLFGGTWARIGVGRTLISAGGDANAVVDENTYTGRGANSTSTTSFPVGETGGELSHTLTAPAEIPAHTHGPGTLKGYYKTRGDDDSGKAVRGSIDYVYSAYDHNASAGSVVINSGATASTGSGGAHNNMSTYLAVYMWKRTA